jgi:ERCC4-related helicase
MSSKKLLSEDKIHATQQTAIDYLYTHDATMLVAATGEGKTLICLTTIKELTEDGHLNCVIVACPPKVVNVWPGECTKWSHLSGLVVTPLVGDPDERLRLLRGVKSDVFVVSLNNLGWLLEQNHPADGIVIDELSKAAGKQAAKLRNKKQGDCFKWRVGMTATPVSQDFIKLQGMTRILDKGAALGRNKDNYLNKYFIGDYSGYKWTLRDGADAEIISRISHLVHIIADNKVDKLPRLQHSVIHFDMPPETRAAYDMMRKDMLVGDIVAVNEAVKSGKLRQIASGFAYNIDGDVVMLDSARIDAAVAWWLDHKRRSVIFYEYVEQGDRLKAVFRKYLSENIKSFIAGEGSVLVAQIGSLSHGVDGLQHVCSDALFYHPVWSRDATEQAIGRVWRQGQKNPVEVTTLVCRETLDDIVVQRVEDRGDFMKLFIKHLKGGKS